MVREQRLTEGGRVRGHQASDIERLPAVVGPEDVVHDQHPILVQGADPHALPAAGRQRVGPVQRAGAQLVAIEVARAHVQQGGAEPVLTGVWVLLDKSDQNQRLQDPVHSPFRQAELPSQFGDAELSRTP